MSIERDVINSALNPQSLFLSECSVLSPRYSLLSNLLRDVLQKGADCKFIATGCSMSPFIKDGDVLTISPLLFSPDIGDVVAFIHPKTGKLNIHRVVSKKGDFYLVKGDNTLEADGFIRKENVIGFMTAVERKGRRISLGLGAERFLIAFLNRNNLFPLLFPFWRLIRPFVKLQ